MSDEPDPGHDVPDPVTDWLSEVAEERGLSERDLLSGLLAGEGAEGLTARVDELDSAVDELDQELDAKIKDVRERVIQVKRETDGKAIEGHDHPDLGEGLRHLDDHVQTLRRDVRELEAETDRLDEHIESVDDRLRQGFSNYEEVLEYLLDVTDQLNGAVETLTEATSELQTQARSLASADGRRAAVDRLRQAAHANGVSKANCEDCGATVHLGLLSAPECPHCAALFDDVESRRGIFRSSVLTTGGRPALEGDVDPVGSAVDRPEPATAEPPTVGPDLKEAVGAEREPPSPIPDEQSDEQTRANDGGVTVEPSEPAAGSEQTAPISKRSGGVADPTRSNDTTGGSDEVIEREATTPSETATVEESLEAISGVGPAYASSLREAGIETVGELARSDPEALARRTDIAPGRVETIVVSASEMVGRE